MISDFMLLNYFYRTRIVCRQFHTSSPRNIHPTIWIFMKPALKVAAWITGRSTRKWYRQLPSEKRKILYSHLIRHRFRYGAIFGTIGVTGSVHYYNHLEMAPITGRRRYMILTAEQLKLLSEIHNQMYAEEYANKTLSLDSKEAKILSKVAKQLLHANSEVDGIKNKKWSIRILDTDMENAMVLPTGDIYFTRGMFESTKNEDQIAIILAHELSHAILNHSGEKLSHLQLLDTCGIFIAFFIWAILPSDWTSMLVNYIYEKYVTVAIRLPFSRFLEEEADRVGLILAARACFDVRESVTFWKTMHENKKATEVPEFISTHPASKKRAETLFSQLPWALDIRRQCKCAPLPENNSVLFHQYSEKNKEKLETI